MPWFLDPREILLTLPLRRWWVALPVVIGLLLALAALLLIPAKYTATTELLVDPQGLQVVKDDISPPGQANDASLFLVDSQVQVLSSDDILRQTVDRFRLDRDPEFNGQNRIIGRLVDTLTSLLNAAGPPHDLKLGALRALRERLKVHRKERTFALSVDVTTEAREKSARLSQGLTEIYLANDQQVRADLAQRAGAAVSARLGELQSEVRDAEEKAQAFRTANNLVGTRNQLVSEQQLGQIGEQLGAARARAAEQLTRLNQVEGVLRAGGSSIRCPRCCSRRRSRSCAPSWPAPSASSTTRRPSSASAIPPISRPRAPCAARGRSSMPRSSGSQPASATSTGGGRQRRGAFGQPGQGQERGGLGRRVPGAPPGAGPPDRRPSERLRNVPGPRPRVAGAAATRHLGLPHHLAGVPSGPAGRAFGPGAARGPPGGRPGPRRPVEPCSPKG